METSGALNGPRARAQEEASDVAGRADLAAIYDAHAASLYRYLLALVSDAEDADDALQEVFLGLMRRGQKNEIHDLQAYLFRAARNQALMVRRRHRRRERQSAAAAISWVDTEACHPDGRELALDITRALEHLPLEQREVVVLKLAEGLTFQEIADMLGIPANTAASRYRLALARLRRLLAGATDDA